MDIEQKIKDEAAKLYPIQIDCININDERIEYDYHEEHREAFTAGANLLLPLLKQKDEEIKNLMGIMRVLFEVTVAEYQDSNVEWEKFLKRNELNYLL